MKKNIIFFLGLITCFYATVVFDTGCAQISAPTGGTKDTIPPVLLRSSPEMNKLNFTGNKITLYFDEYIDEIKDIQANLNVSPAPKNNPSITSNLRTVTIKLKDTLLPNTTYSINFGNAIRDVHEDNVLKDFTYVFSTGDVIDTLSLEGKLVMAETGQGDSTMIAMLYRNKVDSAVQKFRPAYIAKVRSNGTFKFRNLPPGTFKIYGLKDGDGGKTYNSKSEAFAFYDTTVNSETTTDPIMLYAFVEQAAPAKPVSGLKSAAEKKLKYTTTLTAKFQDLLSPLEVSFNNPLKLFDSSRLILTDSNYRPVTAVVSIDSTRKKVSFKKNWQPEEALVLIIPKDAVQDSAGNFLARSDTLRFVAKKETDYGTILLRFPNLDLSRHPVIQFVDADKVKYAFPIVAAEWSNKRFQPGEYNLRILYDSNNNGVWDPGNYVKKLQPEKVINLTQKLAIKANWDNEREIKL